MRFSVVYHNIIEMEIDNLVKNFEKNKEDIRKKYLTTIKSNFSGTDMAFEYSNLFNNLIKEIYNIVLRERRLESPPKVAIFSYGSPGRMEGIPDSDADVFIVGNGTEETVEFKKKYIEILERFNFCKLDIPSWGAIGEIRKYAKTSITEGNQVFETNFIIGDLNIKKEVDKIKSEYNTKERIIRNIIFQKFYFDMYFSQRVRNGSLNIKYCHGGTRDFLFYGWFSELMKKIAGEENGRPRICYIKDNITRLKNKSIISSSEYIDLIKAIDFVIILRSEILRLNRNTEDDGLTFLDAKTLDGLIRELPSFMSHHKVRDKKDLLNKFEYFSKKIVLIKQKIWELTLKEASKDDGWYKNFKSAENFNYEELIKNNILKTEDLLINIALIWGANKAKHRETIEYLGNKLANREEWEIIASLSFSPLCPKETLHQLTSYSIKNKGYGYILRIISRNQNVSRKTLKTIVNNKSLAKRYVELAKIALEAGNNKANNQI